MQLKLLPSLPPDVDDLRGDPHPESRLPPYSQAAFATLKIPGYMHSRHLIPSCKFRTVDAEHPISSLASSYPDKVARRADGERIAAQIGERVQAWRQDSSEDTSTGYLPLGPLYNCVARYVREDGDERGMSLFFAHATGFNKEVWLPSIRALISSSCTPIYEVWLWEAVQHGDSALVNRHNLRGMFTWRDNARDIHNFIINFMPDPHSNPSAVVLPRLPHTISAQRASSGLMNRRLVVVGHSFGGCSSAITALLHKGFAPLLHDLILVDPTILSPETMHITDGTAQELAVRAIVRRDTWPNWQAVRQQFASTPMFQRWDPTALDMYISHGCYEDRHGVHLKTTAIDEALVFADIRTSGLTYRCLPTLDPAVRLLWIMPGEGEKQLGSQVEACERVKLRLDNCIVARVAGAGHLIPQEKPRELGQVLARHLSKLPGGIAKL